MWNRELLKNRAKQTIKSGYWNAFLVSLLLSFAMGGANIFSTFSDGMSSMVENGSTDATLSVLSMIAIFAFIGIVFSILVNIFAVSVLTVGKNNFYLRYVLFNDTNIENITFGFRNKYLNLVKSMFMMNLFIVLWSMLFVIPGYIKHYEYSMVPYILAENPDIDYNRAMEISKKTTYGHKWNMFVLDCSFLGWYLLGILCCCIGVYFIIPYYESTKTHLYLTLKENAIQNGYAFESDFCFKN